MIKQVQNIIGCKRSMCMCVGVYVEHSVYSSYNFSVFKTSKYNIGSTQDVIKGEEERKERVIFLLVS
jgi:hypothetical protein